MNSQLLYKHNLRDAKQRCEGMLDKWLLEQLKTYSQEFECSIAAGDLILLNRSWYVTHLGLIRIARRNRCVGMDVQPVSAFCDPGLRRWAFKATVYKTKTCRGFVGYGDADPSNVSSLVQGAEMRVAETRAVNRALRKAYGIGICSVEEIGTILPVTDKLPPQNANGNNGHNRSVRDQLCRIIRHHKLDPGLVKAYATDFCSVKTLRDASREQVEAFVTHLSDWADQDRNALLCQLNSYTRSTEGVA